jgi:hypothetical protein
MVVDRQVQILPADPSRIALASAIAGDPVADLVEFAELLDVDVDNLARPHAHSDGSSQSAPAPTAG